MTNSVAMLLTLFLLLNGEETGAARILMTPPQIMSHIFLQLNVGTELVQRGHEVHVAVATRFPKPEMVTKMGIGILHYQLPLDAFYPISEEHERMIVEHAFDLQLDWIRESQTLQKALYDICWYMMSDEAFMERVKAMNFDLIMVEPFPTCPCNVILPHHLGLPFVSISATFFPWFIGVPALPSFCGLVLPKNIAEYPELATFFGRLQSLWSYIFIWLIAVPEFWGNTTILQYYRADTSVTKWLDIARQSQLFIYDRDHHLEQFSVPLLPNVLAVPGLTTNPARPLPTKFEKIFVDSAENGVILVTFGSQASNLPAEVVQKFLDAFSRLPQIVVAKFGVRDDVKAPPNVHLLDWLPQNDILGHPYTKLFITHCGGSGQYEAVYHGVPMLGMPLYAEQSWNCERATRKGFGLELSIFDFTVDQLTQTIDRLIPQNSTYRVEVRRMSAILKSYPMNGRQTAAYWIDHVIKFGGKHLRPLSIEQPLYQFLMLDVLLFLVLIAAFLVGSVVCCLRILFRKCQRRHDGGVKPGQLKKNQ